MHAFAHALKPLQMALRPLQLPSEPTSLIGQPEGSGEHPVGTAGQLGGRTDKWMEFLPILQDFVPSQGRYPLRLHNIKVAGQGNR